MSANIDPDRREKLLQARALAELKLYQTYLKKITEGHPLTASEYDFFQKYSNSLSTPESGEAFKYTAAAKYAGVSKRTLSYHVTRGNIRQNDDGTIDKDELDRWLQSKGRKKKAADGERDISAEKEEADLRWRLARAQREELLVSQIRGETLTLEEVLQAWTVRVAEVTAGLQNLVDRLPPLLDGRGREEIRAILTEEIWALRDRYARDGKFCTT